MIRTQWEDGAGLHLFRLDKEIAWAYSAYPQTEYPNNPNPPKKCMDTAEQEKKKKYLHTSLNEHQNFTPFIA